MNLPILGSGLRGSGTPGQWAFAIELGRWDFGLGDVETTAGGVRCRNSTRVESIQSRQFARWKGKCRKWKIQNRLENQVEIFFTSTFSLRLYFSMIRVFSRFSISMFVNWIWWIDSVEQITGGENSKKKSKETFFYHLMRGGKIQQMCVRIQLKAHLHPYDPLAASGKLWKCKPSVRVCTL